MNIRHRRAYSWLLLLIATLGLGVGGWQTLSAALLPPAVESVQIDAVKSAAPAAAAITTIALPTATTVSADDPLLPVAYAPTPLPTVTAAQQLAETVITLPTITPAPATPMTAPPAQVATPIIVAAAPMVQPIKPVVSAKPYNGTGVPIMMYHHIAVPPADADAIRRGLSVTPLNFAAQLDYLSSHNYETITLARYVEWSEATRLGQPIAPLPANPIVLTFDDGYDDIYANAIPLLQQHGMVGTFNIITGKVGWQGYLTWAQLQAMSAAGMDIESHTVNHVDLAGQNPTQLDYELTESKAQLEAHIGRPVTTICYPSGEYNWAVEQAARQAGYLAAITTHYGWSYPSTSLFELPRVRVAGDEALAGFVSSIGGTMASN